MTTDFAASTKSAVSIAIVSCSSGKEGSPPCTCAASPLADRYRLAATLSPLCEAHSAPVAPALFATSTVMAALASRAVIASEASLGSTFEGGTPQSTSLWRRSSAFSRRSLSSS
eukprot:4070784-Pleurochrysis_carterae.AAC.1